MPFAKIAASASGKTTLVAAVSNLRIRVLNYTVLVSADCAVKFMSSGGSDTDLTGAMPFSSNGGASPSGTGQASSGHIGLFETLPGEALSINLGTAVTAAGHLAYQLVP